MSLQTEKMFKALNSFLDQQSPADKEEMNALVQQFIQRYNDQIQSGEAEDSPPDVYDYLELADNAKTKKVKLKYIAQALELEPGNLDALVMQADAATNNPDEYYELLQPILAEGTRQLQKAGCFKDCRGDFWGVVETRPYMRVRNEIFSVLITLGRFKKAIQEGEELLKLCNNDNLGIRYRLMHLYAYTEDIKNASKLRRRFTDYEETQMLLPMCVLFYKLEDLENARTYLTRLLRQNKDAKKFFSAAARGRLAKYAEEMDPYGYCPDTMDDLLYCCSENGFLYESAPFFFSWASSEIRQMKKQN